MYTAESNKKKIVLTVFSVAETVLKISNPYEQKLAGSLCRISSNTREIVI